MLVVGKVNTSLYDDVYFAPVYLILNENVQVKIGIYEFLAEDYTTLLDKDNDLDIAYLDGPLLFKFVTKEYIEEMMEKYELLQDIESSDSEEEEEEEEEEEDVMKQFMYEEDDEEYLDLLESKQDNDAIVGEYKNNDSNHWIEEFYKNNNYSILDNEGKGDCLFASVRDGLKHRNISITVPEIRKMLSENTTKEQFDTYYENYDLFKNEIDDLQDKMSKAKKRHKELAAEYKKTAEAKKEKDRDNKIVFVIKPLKIKADSDAIKPI